MRRTIDDWGLRYPGVEEVEHVYFYGAAIADPPQIEEYLREARRLGREFAVPAPAAAQTTGA
jgi:NAD(P)H dehydrogenase (quinone)